MTRWLAVVSLLALTAGAMQARADVLPTEGGGSGCGEMGKAICEEKTVQKCKEWKVVEYSASVTNTTFSAGYRIECAKWESNTYRTYYPQ